MRDLKDAPEDYERLRLSFRQTADGAEAPFSGGESLLSRLS